MTNEERLTKLYREAALASFDECIKHASCSDCPNSNDPGTRCKEHFAISYLLDHGVIAPPAPIGSTIYMLVTKRPKINHPEFTFIKKTKLTFTNLERVMRDFGETIFLDPQEAQKALEEVVRHE